MGCPMAVNHRRGARLQINVLRQFGIFTYSGTQNLGDAIQTIALARLVPAPALGVERHTGIFPKGTTLIANGWLGNNRLPVEEQRSQCVFAGVFVAQQHNMQWLRSSLSPIGARDPYTERLLIENGIAAEMVGCASLTLPRYRGPRKGIYNIDAGPGCSTAKTAITLTHYISRDTRWEDQWRFAVELLTLYRNASRVYTCRLHAALPCLAFGTPVVFNYPNAERIRDPLVEARMSLLRHLGLEEGLARQIEVQHLAQRYVSFLERSLDVVVREHDPIMPA